MWWGYQERGNIYNSHTLCPFQHTVNSLQDFLDGLLDFSRQFSVRCIMSATTEPRGKHHITHMSFRVCPRMIMLKGKKNNLTSPPSCRDLVNLALLEGPFDRLADFPNAFYWYKCLICCSSNSHIWSKGFLGKLSGPAWWGICRLSQGSPVSKPNPLRLQLRYWGV